MLILAILLTGAAGAVLIACAASALLELALGNYQYALYAVLVGLVAAPVVLIGRNLLVLSTALVST